jgi:DNA-binding LytR/AlgR family response regulator
MRELRCIIVDDEEGAHLVLEHYIIELKTLSLSGVFYNAMEAIDFLHHHPVDLIFLDINMPGLSGLEMLETISNPPFIILTTAYREFALESYKYQVVDYLVKPFGFSKFLAAVEKVWSRKKQLEPISEIAIPNSHYLYLKAEGEMIKVLFSDILYVQSWGNYIKVYTEKGMLLSPLKTTEIEEKLDKKIFMRIHKSYIVSLCRIGKISGGIVVLENDVQLPIGNTFKRNLMDHLNGNNS